MLNYQNDSENIIRLICTSSGSLESRTIAWNPLKYTENTLSMIEVSTAAEKIYRDQTFSSNEGKHGKKHLGMWIFYTLNVK